MNPNYLFDGLNKRQEERKVARESRSDVKGLLLSHNFGQERCSKTSTWAVVPSSVTVKAALKTLNKAGVSTGLTKTTKSGRNLILCYH